MRILFLILLFFVYNQKGYTQNMLAPKYQAGIDTIVVIDLLQANGLVIPIEALKDAEYNPIIIDRYGAFLYFYNDFKVYQFSLATKKLLKTITVKLSKLKLTKNHFLTPMLISGNNGISLALGRFSNIKTRYFANFEFFFYDFQLNFKNTLICTSDNYTEEMDYYNTYYYDSLNNNYLINEANNGLHKLSIKNKKISGIIKDFHCPVDIITGKSYTFKDSCIIDDNKNVILATSSKNLFNDLSHIEAYNNLLYISLYSNMTLLDKSMNSFASKYKLLIYNIYSNEMDSIEANLWDFTIFEKGFYTIYKDKNYLPVLYIEYFNTK